MRLAKIQRNVPLNGATATLENSTLTVKGAKGELTRSFPSKKINLAVEGENIVVTVEQATKREKMMIGTFEAHVKNMVKGVNEGFTYKLKVCASHFPMTVSVEGDTLVVKNFFGEAVPRKVKLKQGAKVNVAGDDITVEATNKELAGQVAADIEQKMRRPGFDRRIFQDGIYIVEKAGKVL